MKRTTLVLSSVFVTLSLFSARVSLEEAQQAAFQFMGQNGATRAHAAEWKLVWTGQEPGSVRRADDAPFYVFSTQGGGFVVVSGDDLVTPVLGYSDHGEFRVDEMPENVRWWFSEYKRQIEWVRSQTSYNDPKASSDWKALRNGTYRKASPTGGSKLIPTALWDQGDPYNGQCPLYGGKRCQAGCVATALAIYLKAVRFPTNVTPATISYTTNKHGLKVSRTLPSSYDWSDDLLPMKYTLGSTAEQKKRVAGVMADCGAISNADYRVDTSPTNLANALLGAASYLGFDKAIELLSYDWFTPAEWDAMLKKELDAGRPLLYGGDGKDGAHQFILDGYYPDYTYHFNWGWSGIANGNYKLTVLGPNGDSSLSNKQNAVFNMKPDEGGTYKEAVYMVYMPNSSELKGLHPSVTQIEKGIPFDVKIGALKNFGLLPFYHTLALLHVDKTGTLIECISQKAEIHLPPNYFYPTYTFSRVTVSNDIAVGDRIVFALLNNDGSYTKIRARGAGVVDEIVLKKPVGIAPTEATSTKVYAIAGGIILESTSMMGKTIAVYGMDGMLKASVKASEKSETIALPTGIYIVNVGRESHKVMVAK